MKLPAFLLSLPYLGQFVYATDTEWLAVLHNNSVSHSVSQRHKLMLKDMGAVHQDTFELGSLRSYAFSGPKDAAERIAQHPDVTYVQPNHNVSDLGVTRQMTPLWNLEEISLAKGSAEYPFEYLYDDSAGNGTVVYIIDSGIDITNKQFGGRAEWGPTRVGGKDGPHVQVDVRGHGTIVAGVVGSECCGVAKKTRLVSIKILDEKGIGKVTDVTWALKWAIDDAKKRGILGRAVINMSLGSKKAPSRWKGYFIADVIAEVVRMGMFVVTAAGNDNSNALKVSPGSAPAACNVGAYAAHGVRADFSNYGPGVDVWAPGVSIWAAESSQRKINGRPFGKRFGSHEGTSFAAPHVAGVAAYLMGLEETKFDPAHPGAINWCDTIRRVGKDAVSPGGVQPLLYNGIHGRIHHPQTPGQKAAGEPGLPGLPPSPLLVAKERWRSH